jgi:hypothetical protein
MALTKTVTKVWPVRAADGRTFSPGIHLVLQDDGVTKIDQDFTALYGGGSQLSQVKATVTAAAQAAIDKYKAEKALNDTAAYTNAVSDVDAALTL